MQEPPGEARGVLGLLYKLYTLLYVLDIVREATKILIVQII